MSRSPKPRPDRCGMNRFTEQVAWAAEDGMAEELLREDDLQQIRARGVGVDDVRQQLAILRNPRRTRVCCARAPPGTESASSARPRSPPRCRRTSAPQARAASPASCPRRVPRRGCSARCRRLLEREPEARRREARAARGGGDKDAREVREVWTSLDRFAFVPSLRAALAARGVDPTRQVRAGDVATVLAGAAARARDSTTRRCRRACSRSIAPPKVRARRARSTSSTPRRTRARRTARSVFT